jgi:hypothetical protein
VEDVAARGTDSSGAKTAEHIKAGFEFLAKQRRKITFKDGEQVILEPVEDSKMPLTPSLAPPRHH